METMRLVAVAVAAVVLVWCSAVTATDPAQTMPCIQKLIPCQPFLHNPTSPPPTCCVPLKEAIDGDVTCLCSVFNNPDMLKSLNLTKSNALDLPKACGANVDINRCNKTTNSTASPTPMTPPGSTNGSSHNGNSTAPAPSSAVTATTVSFIGLNFVAALVATFFF